MKLKSIENRRERMQAYAARVKSKAPKPAPEKAVRAAVKLDPLPAVTLREMFYLSDEK